jgi:thiol:disulfide interchange protein
MRSRISKLILIVFGIILSGTIHAQPTGWQDKISWSFTVEKINDSEAYIVAIAKLINGWHIYSVDHDPAKADYTGYATTFNFKPNKNYKLSGKLINGKKPIVHKDDLGTSLFFEKSGIFKQKIEVLTNEKFDVNFDYSFQVCDELGCLFPPDQEGKVTISGFTPGSQVIKNNDVKTVKEDTSSIKISVDNHQPKKIEKSENNTKEQQDNKETRSLLSIFIEGFVWGLVALFTPCVFPMIPMTVSFFTSPNKSRRKGIFDALIYGLAIIGIYVAVGLLITLITKSPAAVYEISTSATLNLLFFAIFMIFAFSFLGAFEIRMPSKWVNSADKQADKGGLIGIFFMAFTLVLVSFSCTGPIIGTSLVNALSSGSIGAPAVVMLGFSVALALPFMLFAFFPGMISSLPQSGGWLNSVKVVLGLLEIALAMKFLSMVDLAYHWNILTREIFIAIWFVVFTIIGFYLLGKLRFSHDSIIEKLSVTRFMFAFSSLVFAVYLLPGMWGAPLFMIDGVAPPRTHSEDNFRWAKGASTNEIAMELASMDKEEQDLFKEYRKHMHEVGDGSILVFHDLDIAREYARKVNKPILLDFTGHSCANCRKTESKVWTNDKIKPILQNELVIASLYCDDRTPLPESEVRFSEVLQGKLKNIGNKWSEYQIIRYNQITQPLYIIQDLDDNDLTKAIGYTPNIDEYRKFLEEGIKKFNKNTSNE